MFEDWKELIIISIINKNIYIKKLNLSYKKPYKWEHGSYIRVLSKEDLLLFDGINKLFVEAIMRRSASWKLRVIMQRTNTL